ncbi:MAG: hypothetical protein QW620_01335 [Thermoplasmata archaeon]
MKISTFLLIGMLLLSISYFSARENPDASVSGNVKLVPGAHAVIDTDGNLKIDFGTVMSGTRIVYTNAFGIQNLNEVPVKISKIQIITNGKGATFTVIPSENIVISQSETMWFTVSIEVGNETGIVVGGKIVPVIA